MAGNLSGLGARSVGRVVTGARGLTIVLVTHDSAIARRSLGVAVMSRGQLAMA